ncbi:ATP-binding cassette domain-containing protein [Sneathiella aquimaris]|uniref:ATP-binding cassette domain-containing protein n=1 Tax=Sneathiella aquimaris TaxID=2599305 RepID=UPI00146F6505|nr:ATP-binding cassette domain-containing protein [Sneathiella aquimaris]
MTSLFPVAMRAVTVGRKKEILIGPIDLVIEGEGCTILMGPNGSGKTTLLRLLHGLERPRSGVIDWQDSSVSAQKQQSFVFQSPTIMRRSVLENILYPLKIRDVPRRSALRKAETWLEKVGLLSVMHQKADVLSGGEKQKLAAARALITRPSLLFLDEPTANLDGASTLAIEGLVQGAMEEGTKIVMATHDVGQAKRLATEVLFLHHGKLKEKSEAAAFFGGPDTKEASVFLKGGILV